MHLSRTLPLLLASFILAGCVHRFEPPAQWAENCNYSGETKFARAAIVAEDPDAKELLLRIDAEQRCMFTTAFASQAQRKKLWPKIEPIQSRLLKENSIWLKSKLQEKDLLDISQFGSTVSQAAWLVVQHADHDPAWQKEALPKIEKLYQAGKFKPSQYALMTDRIAVNSGEMQTFGSQGACNDDGTWKPKPIRNMEQVDARRKTVELEPLADYIKKFNCK